MNRTHIGWGWVATPLGLYPPHGLETNLRLNLNNHIYL